MLVWQGFGIAAALIPIGLIVVVTVLWGAIAGSSTPGERDSTLIIALAVLASAPLVYLLGKRLDARPGRTMVDKATGQEVVLRDAHTLFFVGMKYWAWLFAIGGIVLLVVALLPQG
jgi:hypothetical protein